MSYQPERYEGPGQYRHHKGGTYTVIDVATHESTGQRFVIYRSNERGHLIARPLDIGDTLPKGGANPWNVDTPDGTPRFEKIDP